MGAVIKNNNKSTGSADSSTVSANVIGEPTMPGAGAAAPNLFDSYDQLESRMHKITALSQEGKDYVEKLTKILVDEGKGDIFVESLGHRIETLVAFSRSTKMAYIVIFNESYMSNQPFVPAGDYIPDLARCLEERYQEYHLLQYANILECDYSRVRNMANHILNCFDVYRSRDRIGGATFAGMQLVAQSNLEQANNFIKMNSPHEIRARADWGVLVYRQEPNQRAQMFNNREQDLRPMMAMVGYTKFIRVNAGYDQTIQMPITVITDIVSAIPSIDIINVALPATAGMIIQSRKWLSPYLTGAKDGPNLGRLKTFVDKADGQPKMDWFESESRVGEIIRDIPWLAIDFPEGRATIPGLEMFVANDSTKPETDFVNANLNRFFGTAGTPAGQRPIIIAFTNYEGTYVRNGQTIDTRYGDFDNTIIDLPDWQRCESMQDQSLQLPGKHLDDIAKVYGESSIHSYYRVTTIVFNGLYVNQLAAMFSSLVQSYRADIAVNQTLNVASVLTQQPGIIPIGGANAFYGGIPTGYNSYMPYYRR